MMFNMGRSYGPTPFYQDIPLWFVGFPTVVGHDSTLTYNDQTKPQGVVMISGTELRMIQAESQFLLGDLVAAKAAVKAAPLLPTNHVHLGREPTDPPMTQAEIDAYVDPMDATALRQVIDGLNREDQYISARRAVRENGAAIMPFKLHPAS